jgi:hypothetical protein
VAFKVVKLFDPVFSKVWGAPARGVLVSGFLGGKVAFMKNYSKGNMKKHF